MYKIFFWRHNEVLNIINFEFLTKKIEKCKTFVSHHIRSYVRNQFKKNPKRKKKVSYLDFKNMLYHIFI